MGKSTDVFEKKQTTRQFERFFCSFGEQHYSCKRVAAVGSLMPQLQAVWCLPRPLSNLISNNKGYHFMVNQPRSRSRDLAGQVPFSKKTISLVLNLKSNFPYKFVTLLRPL